MKRLCTLLFLSLSISFVSSAQVRVQEDAGISRLMSDFLYQNQQRQTVKGWRILIVTTNDRRRSETAKANFEAMYPDIQAYWEQDVPMYKVKVGAFANKDALQGLLLDIKKEFPSAIPIVEEVRKVDLIP